MGGSCWEGLGRELPDRLPFPGRRADLADEAGDAVDVESAGFDDLVGGQGLPLGVHRAHLQPDGVPPIGEGKGLAGLRGPRAGDE